MSPRNLFRQRDRRSQVPILTHDDCDFVGPVVCERDEIDRDAHVHAFFLAANADTAAIDVYSSASKEAKLVGPEAMPERVLP